ERRGTAGNAARSPAPARPRRRRRLPTCWGSPRGPAGGRPRVSGRGRAVRTFRLLKADGAGITQDGERLPDGGQLLGHEAGDGLFANANPRRSTEVRPIALGRDRRSESERPVTGPARILDLGAT